MIIRLRKRLNSSISLIDRTLTVTIARCLSAPASNNNEGLHHIL